MSINANRSLLGFIEPGDQRDDRGFARTGFADDGDGLVCGDLQTDLFQYMLVRLGVFEADIIKHDFTFNRLKSVGIFFVHDIRLDIHDLGKPLKTGGALLELFGKINQSANRIQNEINIQDKGQQVARGNLTAKVDQNDASGDHDEKIAFDQQTHHRKENRHNTVHLFLGGTKADVDDVEFVNFLFFVGIRLNLADSLDGVFDAAIDVSDFLADITESPTHTATVKNSPANHERYRDDRDSGQWGIETEHGDKGPDDQYQ